jgi:hypothetical protein
VEALLMNMLSTAFDGQALPAAVPGQWSASSSVAPVPSLPGVSEPGSGEASSLAAPWDAAALTPSRFPTVSELPTL